MATAKKATAKRAGAKKSTTAVKNSTAKKTAGKKVAAKKTASRKTVAKKTASQKIAAKKTAARKPAKSTKTASRKTAKGAPERKYSPHAGQVVAEEMHEMHRGQLHIGRSNKRVTDPKQAIAIGLAMARREGDKVPPNPNSGR